MPNVHCDNRHCEYNVGRESCMARVIYFVKGECKTMKHLTNAPAEELMRQTNCNCIATWKGYKSK
jgi:hypothetical protein